MKGALTRVRFTRTRRRRTLVSDVTGAWFADERWCEECGEAFWASRKAEFCSSSCRSRAWRKRRSANAATNIAGLCAEVLSRRGAGSNAYTKLYPRLLRAVAAELRRAGWDPIALLLSRPTQPSHEDETAPGGIEAADHRTRRKWFLAPEDEIGRLLEVIQERRNNGRSVLWHVDRLRMLRQWLEEA